MSNKDHNCPDCQGFVHQFGESYILCDNCRRQLAVGKAVENMPIETRLYHSGKDEWMFCVDRLHGSRIMSHGTTPLVVLKEGMK